MHKIINRRAGAVRTSFLLTLLLAMAICLGWYYWSINDEHDRAFKAVELGDLQAVQEIIATQPALLTENKHHPPSMIVMAAFEHPDLLQAIAPVVYQRTQNRYQLWNALSMAVRNNDLRAVEILLESGWDPNSGASSSLLVEACRQQNPKLIQLLLEHKVDPSAALSWACEHGDADLAARFLAMGADPSAPRALAHAVAHGELDLANELLSKGANPADGLSGVNEQTPRDLLASLIREGDFSRLDEDQQTEAVRNLRRLVEAGILDPQSLELLGFGSPEPAYEQLGL